MSRKPWFFIRTYKYVSCIIKQSICINNNKSIALTKGKYKSLCGKGEKKKSKGRTQETLYQTFPSSTNVSSLDQSDWHSDSSHPYIYAQSYLSVQKNNYRWVYARQVYLPKATFNSLRLSKFLLIHELNKSSPALVNAWSLLLC